MSDNREFINIIKAKFKGEQYDFKTYYKKIDNIINKTYNNITNSDATEDSINEAQINETFLVSCGTFRNECWEKLEDKNMMAQLYYKEFLNDAKMVSFLKITFRNILLDSLNKVNPGFRSRKKQVRRVLNPLCSESSRKEFNQWKLKQFENKDITPATFEQLKDVASNIPLPEIKYPASDDMKGSPRINDKDMENFLIIVLEKAGGAIEYKVMDKFISDTFNLENISQFSVGTPVKQNDQGDDHYIEINQDKVKILIGSDHHLMAEQLFQDMTRDMQDLIYYRFIKEVKQGEYASQINKSTGTVSRKETKLTQYMNDIVRSNDDEYRFTIDEFQIIFETLKELIIENKQEAL
jgi:hypothetical protein